MYFKILVHRLKPNNAGFTDRYMLLGSPGLTPRYTCLRLQPEGGGGREESYSTPHDKFTAEMNLRSHVQS